MTGDPLGQVRRILYDPANLTDAERLRRLRLIVEPHDPWGEGRNPLGCCADRTMHGGPDCRWPGDRTYPVVI